MKKLIISALAAAALLFGFASCSGDLHDSEAVDMSTITIAGSFNGYSGEALKVDTDGTYYYELKDVTSETIAFGLLDNDKWAYRGKSATGEDCAELKEGDTTNLYWLGSGMKNAEIAVTVGASYKLTFTPGAGYITTTVKCTKEATPVNLIVDDATYSMSPSSNGYRYFYQNNDAAGTLKFYVNSTIIYWAPKSNTELTVGDSPLDTDPVYNIPTTTYSFKYEKGVKYMISVSLEDGEASVSVAKNFMDLTGFAIYGDCYGDTTSASTYKLEPDSDVEGGYSVELTYNNDWAAWGGGNGKFVFKVTNLSTWYGNSVIESSSSDYTISGDDNAELSTLKNGQKYKFTFVGTNSDGKIKLTITEL